MGQFWFSAADPETRLQVQEFYLGGDHKQYRSGVRGRETGKDGGDAYSACFSEIAEGLSAPLEPGSRAWSEGGLRLRAGHMPTSSKSPAWMNRAPAQKHKQAGQLGGWGVVPPGQGPLKASAPSTSSFRAPPEPSLAAGTLKGNTRATAGTWAGGTQWVQPGTQGLSEEEPILLGGSLGLTPAPQTTPP